MSRGGSFGGGQSSLSYLFESDEPRGLAPKTVKITKPPSECESPNTKETTTKAPASNSVDKNNKISNKNSGCIITGRPSTRVRSVPGGASSLGYLFGDDQQ